MKKLILIAAALSASLMLSSCNKQEIVESPKSITVHGSNKIETAPDLAVLTFSVTTTGWSAKAITNDNNVITTKLVDAIKNVGVSEEDIFKTDCIISNPGNSYEAKRNVIVTARNLSLIGQIVDCKTTQIKLSSISYKLNDTVSLLRQVRTGTIKNAQDIASLLAGASGSKIGRVLKIVDGEIITKDEPNGKISIATDSTVTFELQ